MSQDLTRQALQMFDTAEKWEAFVELKNQSDKFFNALFGKLKPLMHKHFFEDDRVEGWECKQYYVCDMRWYLKDLGEHSISLYWGWNGQLRLWFSPGKNDAAKIYDLMKNSDYSKLFSAFDRIDDSLGNEYICLEKGNFYFDSPLDGNISDWQLAWYAGNKSQELINQLAVKVNRFRKDPGLTELLYRLNKETEKNKVPA